MTKVGVIYNIPSPYREGFFEQLNIVSDIEYYIFYCSYNKPGRNWNIIFGNYKYKIMNGIELFNGKFLNIEVIRNFKKYDLDAVIIAGYAYPTALISFISAKIFNIPIILWSASAYGLKNKKNNIFYHHIKKFLVKISDGYIVPGEQAKKQIMFLGGNELNVFKVPFNSLNNSWFQQNLNHQIFNKRYFNILYVGRLIRDKGIHTLIRAISFIKENDVLLHIVGDGPFQNELKQLKLYLNCSNVIFHGNINHNDLIKYYASADLFILPTLKDEWPLVLLEAMSSCLPIITTNNVGSIPDLLYDYPFIINANDDPNELKQKIIEYRQLDVNTKSKICNMLYNRSKHYSHENAAYCFDSSIKILLNIH